MGVWGGANEGTFFAQNKRRGRGANEGMGKSMKAGGPRLLMEKMRLLIRISTCCERLEK